VPYCSLASREVGWRCCLVTVVASEEAAMGSFGLPAAQGVDGVVRRVLSGCGIGSSRRESMETG
jgi:hypothetical protein